MLGEALEDTDWRCFAYAVMSSHIHLGVMAGHRALKGWSGEANGQFAEWINHRNDRIGAVFVRGPKKIAVRADGVRTLTAYIHQNPVRAGVIEHPADGDWTSHQAYAGLAAAPPWLDIERGTRLAGFDSPREFAAWIEAAPVSRAELDAARVEPKPQRGRPRTKNAAQQSRTSTVLSAVNTLDVPRVF